mgnify:CR=1 FL=1
MKISIGSDHGGYHLKEKIITHLKTKNYSIIDHGCYNNESCDYPDYGKATAESVALKNSEFGIVICTTGIGISISANKVKGIRAGLCWNEKTAEMARKHNNCNVIAIGAANQDETEAIKIIDKFLNTPFEGGRHERRVNKIMTIE